MRNNDDATTNDGGQEGCRSAVRDAVPMSAAAALLAAPPEGATWRVDDLPTGLLVLVDGGAVIVNAGWSTLSGLELEESVGQGWWRAIHPGDRDRLATAVRLAVPGGQVVDCRVVGSEVVWVRAHLRPVLTRGGCCVMAVTEVDPHGFDPGAAPSGLASYDSLTGLLDRASFLAEVARVLDQAPAEHALVSAVLFVDLDHFKEVNDVHGHQVGDRVLVAVCRRVQSVLRAGDSLGRLGGDELAVFVPTLDAPEEASRLAERIVRACDDVFTIDGETVHVGASVGVAFSDDDDCTAATVVHNADRAMYRAKAEGRGRWSVFASTPGQHPRDHSLEARAILDQAGRSILRAERRITALWRDVIDLRDDPFSTSLVDGSHALRRAARVLDRHAERYGSASTPPMPHADVDAVNPHLGAGTKAPDPGRTSDASSTTAREKPVTTIGESTGPEEEAAGRGGVTVSRDDHRVCVRMWGEHDLSTARLLSTALVEAVAADDLDVVLDLSDLTFMDGSTVRSLVQGRALLTARDRRLSVQSPSRGQRRLLEICDLADLIEPTPDGNALRKRGEPTPLATWVEIPAMPQPAKGSSPVDADVARDDPERSRR